MGVPARFISWDEAWGWASGLAKPDLPPILAQAPRKFRKKRAWVCRCEYYNGAVSISYRVKDKNYAKVLARFLGGYLQRVLWKGSLTPTGKRRGTWTSMEGCDPQDVTTFRLSRETLERRVRYGGRKGRRAARRLSGR